MSSSPLSTTTEIPTGAVSIRRLGPDDRATTQRLAQVDSRRLPAEPLLGAEIEGRLLAATSLATGETVADPFSRTDELRALLELRAAQLRRRVREGGRPLGLPRSRARLALGGSPPGAPGWLLALRARPY
jgi:hypothetical protein